MINKYNKYYIILYYIISYYIILCYIILHYIMLHYIIFVIFSIINTKCFGIDPSSVVTRKSMLKLMKQIKKN